MKSLPLAAMALCFLPLARAEETAPAKPAPSGGSKIDQFYKDRTVKPTEPKAPVVVLPHLVTPKGLPSEGLWSELHTSKTSSEYRVARNLMSGEIVVYNPKSEEVVKHPVTGKFETVKLEPSMDKKAVFIKEPLAMDRKAIIIKELIPQKNNFVGTWKDTAFDFNPWVTFNADKTYFIAGNPPRSGTYSVVNGEIQIEFSTFYFQGSELYWRVGDNKMRMQRTSP